MTLIQLRQFTLLAKAGSFVKASVLLHITQPALSRSIKALELELGQLLFDRIGKKIELTAFGASTLQRCQLLLEEAEGLKLSGKPLARNNQGRLRLGLSSGPGALLTIPMLSHVANHFPKLHLDIFRANTETLVRMLRERQVDALVVDVRSMQPSPDLKMDQPIELDGAFMCRPDHPLATAAKVSFQQLLRYPIASTPLSDELARILIERYGENAHPQVMVKLTSDEISHLEEVALQSNTVVLAVRAACPRLADIKMSPAMNAVARFGLVTMANKAEALFLPEIRQLMAQTWQAMASQR